MRNSWKAKVLRTFTSILPVSDKRVGSCKDCGQCCKLPNLCWFLRYKKDGSSYCSIHTIRPLNCRRYPRTDNEHLTKSTCGFSFK